MAIIHRAELRPSKLELLAGWVPGRPWGVAAALEQVGAYRFDDPAGEVGVETFVLRAGGVLLHVPLTYRGAPAPAQAAHLVGTLEHSVLGRRWVYDACGDPVYVAAALTGAPQAEELVVTDGRQERREPTARVGGSGVAGDAGPLGDLTVTDSADATTVRTGGLELVVRRVLDPAATADGAAALAGTWAGQDRPVLLATARRVQPSPVA
ncbi:maltokinase N-terminal cap-like domain-containing protein [Geodermatophilus sp. DSM 44513]|uniref:maltokinase N-terminal cap-like domain-containing protein n=1 Tax=Geodermatophilus sp. DSM 44513 TaxID=1528104 RepID=UPI001283CBBE|nr:hypothetical protein [Geodermatophilus sp. DSM 44513]WNV73652.1 hypothetical protein RTG05_11710 [Geodermatophilus sp. DSM 44513]